MTVSSALLTNVTKELLRIILMLLTRINALETVISQKGLSAELETARQLAEAKMEETLRALDGLPDIADGESIERILKGLRETIQ